MGESQRSDAESAHRHRRRRPCRPVSVAGAQAGARRRPRRGHVRPGAEARSARRQARLRHRGRGAADARGARGLGRRSRRRPQPILDMVITDSRLHDPVRPTFLTFDGEVGEGEAFAHMVTAGDLTGALVEACRAGGRRACRPEGVDGFRTERDAHRRQAGGRRHPAGRVAGRGRWRPLAPARTGGHRLDLLALSPVRHRRHHRARARSRRAGRSSTSCPPAPSRSCRSNPKSQGDGTTAASVVHRLERAHRQSCRGCSNRDRRICWRNSSAASACSSAASPSRRSRTPIRSPSASRGPSSATGWRCWATPPM